MALINCPNCNKEISDKAKVCVGCGHQLIDDVNAEKTMLSCPECGAFTDTLTDICSNCGYPLNSLEIKSDGKQKSKSVFKKKWFWASVICFVLLISIVLFVLLISIVLFVSNNVRTESYNIEICTVVDEIMAVSAEAENVGNQICSVWNNAIFDKDNENTAKYTSTAKDFNEALSNLFADEEFIDKITTIRNKQSEIDTYLGKLKNPPEKFEDAYDEFKELYYAYSDYVDSVILCKGSYNTYTEDLSKKSSVLMESYREIKVELLGE